MTRTFTEIDEAWSYFHRLRSEGHALQATETRDHANKFLSVAVTHFLTCPRCAEIKQEDPAKAEARKADNGKVGRIKG